MKQVNLMIKSNAFQYYGGKWRIAKWIISYFPKHDHYVEVFGGAGSVLLQRPINMSKLETFNDIDQNVVNFFECLRDCPDELIYKINLTPWSRYEFDSRFKVTDDPIEKARLFWLGCMMSIRHSPFKNSGMSMSTKTISWTSQVLAKLDHLLEIAKRLRRVQIENLSYSELIPRYDQNEFLFYVDPPYLPETRTFSDNYDHDFTDKDHIDLAEMLMDCKGYVILSGYKSPMYYRLYEDNGWVRFDKKHQNNKGDMIDDSIWISPKTIKALKRFESKELF